MIEGLTVTAGLMLALFAWGLWRTRVINRRWPAIGRMLRVEGYGVHVLAGQTEATATPPLLLVHGAASNAREMPAALGARLERWRWVAPDRPGLGHSEGFPEACQLAAQARQMAGVIEQYFPGEKVIAVGHSWGTAVSLRLALDRPDLVAGVVAVAPACHPWGTGTTRVNRMAMLPAVGPLLRFLIVPLVAPLLAPTGIARGFAPGPVKPADYGDRIGTPLFFRPGSFLANAADLYVADGELRTQAVRYPQVTCPAAVISGQGDQIVANTIHARALARDLPHATTHRVPGGGHMPHWVDPDLVMAEISRIAAAVSRPSDG